MICIDDSAFKRRQGSPGEIGFDFRMFSPKTFRFKILGKDYLVISNFFVAE